MDGTPVETSSEDEASAARVVRERDAIIGIIVAAIHADGRVRLSELREAALQAQGALLGFSGAEVMSRLGEVRTLVGEKGENEFVRACLLELSFEGRVRAFHAAIEIMAADQEVPPSEVRYLQRLARALDVPGIMTQFSNREPT